MGYFILKAVPISHLPSYFIEAEMYLKSSWYLDGQVSKHEKSGVWAEEKFTK